MDKKTSKNDPKLEAVKQVFKATELLNVDVCEPVKEKLNKIEICVPNINSMSLCFPLQYCHPFFEICKPKTPVICGPSKFHIPELEDLKQQLQLDPKQVVPELKDMSIELKNLQKEIEELKNSLKRK